MIQAPEARPLPSAVDTERLVLGAVFVEEDAASVIDQLDAGLWSTDEHRLIWQVMNDLRRGKQHVDRVTVANELMKRGALQSVGGLTYLSTLDQYMPKLYNIHAYVDILRQKAIARGILQRTDLLQARVFAGDTPVEDLLAELSAMTRTFEVQLAARNRSLETLQEFMERLGINGLTTRREEIILTRWPRLNAVLGGGFEASHLVVVAGRPSSGKTAMALDIALSQQKAGLIVSLETTKLALTRRFIASLTGIPVNAMRRGELDGNRVQAINRAWQHLLNATEIELWDESSLTARDLMPVLRLAAARGRLNWLLVDYLQLLEGDSRKDRRLQVEEASRLLKNIAKEFGIPVIVLSQLNRRSEQEKRKPGLHDLRESGSIEQDADVVLLTHAMDRKEVAEQWPRVELRPETDGLHYRSVIVAKQKDGPLRELPFFFDGAKMRFEELLQQSSSWANQDSE